MKIDVATNKTLKEIENNFKLIVRDIHKRLTIIENKLLELNDKIDMKK